MKTFKDFLAEARGGPRGTTALLPATMALHDKKKVSIAEIGAGNHFNGQRYKTTVQIAHLDGDPKKVRFITGSGHGGYESKYDAHHDQTGARLGRMHVVNTVHLDGHEIVHHDNTLHLGDKAPRLVYK